MDIILRLIVLVDKSFADRLFGAGELIASRARSAGDKGWRGVRA